jgi:hypothetical protein
MGLIFHFYAQSQSDPILPDIEQETCMLPRCRQALPATHSIASRFIHGIGGVWVLVIFVTTVDVQNSNSRHVYPVSLPDK